MPKPNRLPPEVIKIWPEVFGDVDIKAVPIQYIKSINVSFTNGKKWVIDVDQEKLKLSDSQTVEDMLEDFFDQYDDMIDSVDFTLNTLQVKTDIQKRTKDFMKKRK